ncbi:siphovirus Gp157 family protein [Moraxella bovoculi]|uniref:siphovirus Gp157 family protein n=1 Tax=Moraxella bovoculi TaxID=386891 RepID=UPI003F502158
MNLYEITVEVENRIIALQDRLDEDGAPPTDEELQEILDLIEGDLSAKVKAYGYVVKNTQSNVDELDSEIKRLTAKKRKLQKRTDTLKSSMQTAMEIAGIDKIDDPVMPIRLQNSPKSLHLSVPVEELPDAFQNIEISVKTTQLKKALADGMKVKGAELVQHKHIRIG